MKTMDEIDQYRNTPKLNNANCADKSWYMHNFKDACHRQCQDYVYIKWEYWSTMYCGTLHKIVLIIIYACNGILGIGSGHWDQVTHICIGKLTIIGSDNGLSPGRHLAIIWTKAGILSTGPSGTNFSEILIEIQKFSLKKIRLKMSSAKCCPFSFGLNALTAQAGLCTTRHMHCVEKVTVM